MSTTLIGWPDWATRGACRTRLADWDVPDGRLSPTDRRILRRAITTCRLGCPVINECADWAKTRRWVHVVIAGACYDYDAKPCKLCRRCKRPLVGMRPFALFCGDHCREAHARETAA